MENFSSTIPKILAPPVGMGAANIASSASHAGLDVGGIPGFDVIQRLFLKLGLDPSLLVTLGMSLTVLTSLFSFFTYSIGSLTALTRFVSANLVSSATIHSSDVTYVYIMRWLAVHKVSTDCRLFCVTSRKNPQSHAVRRYSYAPYGDSSRSSQDDDEDAEDDGEDDRLGPKLKFMPAPGFLHFWHQGRPIIVNRKLDLSYYTGDIPDETIVLTTIGRSPTFLREILNEARRDYLQAQSRKTMVYTLSPTPFAQKTWDQGRHRPSRDLSTVIMPPEDKQFLLQDVNEYLNRKTMRWYAQRGLPYRRGYLFYGPPGTGKTSLSLALAGELKLPLYILSLSTGSLTDETLTMLFVGLPRKCIVLLEDIDCAGVHRETNGWSDSSSDEESGGEDDEEDDTRTRKKPAGRGGGGAKSASDGKSNGNTNKPAGIKPNHNKRPPRSAVSFSGLLNAIDGVASHEGRILIMTTNHRERLDSALIRPGRVDVQIEFGYASRGTLAEIFRELYKEIGERKTDTAKDETVAYERKGVQQREGFPEKAPEGHCTLAADRVHKMAEEFAEQIPENRFTPAEIQGFLMSYKRDPERAMANIKQWVAMKTKTKPHGRRRSLRPGSKNSSVSGKSTETTYAAVELPITPPPSDGDPDSRRGSWQEIISNGESTLSACSEGSDRSSSVGEIDGPDPVKVLTCDQSCKCRCHGGKSEMPA